MFLGFSVCGRTSLALIIDLPSKLQSASAVISPLSANLFVVSTVSSQIVLPDSSISTSLVKNLDGIVPEISLCVFISSKSLTKVSKFVVILLILYFLYLIRVYI